MPQQYRRSLVRPLYVTLALATGLGAVFLLFNKSSPPQSKQQPKLVRTVLAQSAKHQPEIILLGKVMAHNISDLSIETAAPVIQRLVMPGQSVKKDQILLKLAPQDMQLAIKKTQADIKRLTLEKTNLLLEKQHQKELLTLEQAQYRLNEKRLARQNKLHKEQLTSEIAKESEEEAALNAQEKILERKQALAQLPNRIQAINQTIIQQQTLLKRQQLDLKRLTVTAPYNGSILQQHVAVGEWATPNKPLITLYDSDSLYIAANIPNKYLDNLRHALQTGAVNATLTPSGQSVYLKYIRNFVATGELGQVGHFYANPSTDTKLVFGNAYQMTAQLPSIDSYALPKASLYPGSLIYLVADQQLSPIQVTLLGEMTDPKTDEGLVLIQTRADIANQPILAQHLSNAKAGLAVSLLN